MSEPKKTIDADVRERMEAACRAIMADHPEVEAIGTMFLSRQLAGVLSGMIVGADGPRLRPDQNVRLFEVWVRIGMQLLANNQRDHAEMDAALGRMARSFIDAKAERERTEPQRASGPADGGP
jgi:hypothetical protein